jgi:hypothetical protein
MVNAMRYHADIPSEGGQRTVWTAFKSTLSNLKTQVFIALGVSLLAMHANAAVNITIQPSSSGTDVVATLSGSHKIVQAMPFGVDFGASASVGPRSFIKFSSAIDPASTTMTRLTVESPTCSGDRIGPSSNIVHATSTSVTGAPFAFFFTSKLIYVPTSSRLNDVINVAASMTYANKTLADMGLAVGTLTCSWGPALDRQSMTISVLSSPAPVVTSISPNSGATTGGTAVTITGTNLTGATGVMIGGVSATNVTVLNATTITATTPAHASGSTSVEVTTPGGGNGANTLFTYVSQSQSGLTVNASPSALNASTTTSTLSTSGGSGTGAVSYAMTAGTCTLSGNTVTASSANETCTVTATKAADSTYEAAMATVDITVSFRATLASAANDASVIRTQATQLMQSQAFTQSQVQNITNHLDGVRYHFNLMPSHFGIRLHAPSLDPIKPLIYKVKDVWLGSSESSSSPKGHRVVARQDAQTGVGGAFDGETPADAFEQQSANAEQNPSLERGAQRYSWWSAGTVDTGLFRTGANRDEESRFRLNGLTFGVDYKAGPRSIVGLALGLGYGTDTASEHLGKVKSSQKSLTGYGVMGFGDGWVVDGLLGYGSQTFSGDRTTSDGLATLSFRRPGDSVFMSGSVRKVFEFQPWRMAVFLRDDVTKIRLHRYVESGAADYALGYQSVGSTNTNVSAGLNISNDMDLDGGKLTTTVILGVNRGYSSSRSQGVFYADVGVAGGVHPLNQPFNDQTFQSLSLGVMYVNKSGDGVDFSWMKSVGSRRDKLTRLRFGLNFAL